MECPICFEIIENSCIGSCMHHYCYKCLIKWISFGGIICPSCKQTIYEIKMDKEFDLINNPNNINIVIEQYTRKLNVIFESNKPPGITIENLTGLGVKIIKLNKKDVCYNSGLRVGDVILKLNNIPCYSHDDAIKVIKNSYEKRQMLICDLLIKSNN